MSTRVMKIVSFTDETKSIMSYLFERTADTVGSRVDRSAVILVGKVRETEIYSLPVRRADLVMMRPWLSGEAGAGNRISVQFTRVKVERRLFGVEESEEIEIAYAYSSVGETGGPEFAPVFCRGDRGLFFLKRVSAELPYEHLRRPSYQFAPGEKGMRSFLMTDYDKRGEPFVRDETAEVEAVISSVRWYTALPKEKDCLIPALTDALDDPNPRVARHAVRALAILGDETAAGLLKERLWNADEDLRVRLMLGLWIAGERKIAKNVLLELFRKCGKYSWLARWGIEVSLGAGGRPAGVLYGPDPAEYKGD
ncbi:MAG: HEAT repeat domain-containing protein [Bacillota bacterium]